MKRVFALITVAAAWALTSVPLFSQVSAPGRGVQAAQPKPGWHTNETALQALAFGTPAANGLRAACYFLPAKETYAEGEGLKRHVVFHNSGKQPVLFSIRNAGDDDLCTANDEQGLPVPKTHVAFSSIASMEAFRLEPGEVVDVDRYYTTLIGERPSDGPSPPASTLIEAKPGTACLVSWELLVVIADAPLGMKTGQVRFRVQARDVAQPER